MLQAIRKHMRSNAGDSHVSKMTIIAIVFVVGAILLVLTTSAFRSPVNNWFSKVTAGWFADNNGMYEADNPLIYFVKNENGTYQGVTYYKWDKAAQMYFVIKNPEALQNGAASERIPVDYYDADGSYQGSGTIYNSINPNIYIHDDGIEIDVFNSRYQAYIP